MSSANAGMPSPVTAETAIGGPFSGSALSASRRSRLAASIRSILFQTSITRVSVGCVDAEIGEDAFDILGLRRGVRVGDVAQMHDEVGLDHLLQRRAEGGDQVRRQVGDEADRVGQDHRRAVRQLQPPQRRIERGEQHVFGEDAGAGQPVEQRRFAGIGVADDARRPGTAPSCAWRDAGRGCGARSPARASA